jgi:hypothetical protein
VKVIDEEMRFQAHERLLELDAATVEMMKFVTLDQLGSPEWRDAVQVQREAFETLQATFAGTPQKAD